MTDAIPSRAASHSAVIRAAEAMFNHRPLVFIDGHGRNLDASWDGQTNSSMVRMAFCELAEVALRSAANPPGRSEDTP